jgi:predicted dehydrogenase
MNKKTERKTPSTDDYSLSKASPETVGAAPDLPYQPRDPKSYRPAIGMIACGGITETHLTAYKKAGYNVVALCDLIEDRARKRQKQFYPNAEVTTDYRQVLARNDIEVVDIATHPKERLPLIEDALKAGKHVLSQKPFVLDLDDGQRLVDLARQQSRKLAVKSGLLGDLIFYDFAIHWFDIVSHLLGSRRPLRVLASRSRAIGQTARPPMLAQALVEFEGGQASLVFDAHIRQGSLDHTYVGGTKGTIQSLGPNLRNQTLTLFTAEGSATPQLEGNWFTDGFHGTMGELLCAIEEDREPINSARENLNSLALCFAAIASATDGRPKVPGEVRRLPAGSAPGV